MVCVLEKFLSWKNMLSKIATYFMILKMIGEYLKLFWDVTEFAGGEMSYREDLGRIWQN